MDLGLTDRVVVVTGASGGIGRALVTVFAEEGAKVVAHGFSGTDALRAWVATRPWADRVVCAAADLTEESGAEELFATAVEAFGRVDHVAANAGHYPIPDLLLDETPVPDLRRTLDENLVSALLTARAFFATLRATGPRADEGASLTFTGSTAGRFGEARHIAYATAKAGLLGAVHTLKNEIVHLDPWGRVNVVEPGWTATERVRAALEKPGLVERAVRTMPLRQLARPVDIARAFAVLASPVASRHVSGQFVTVAGGMEGRQLWEPADVDPASIRRRLDG